MREIFSIIAGLIALGGYVPYAIDIMKGRAKPARSARFMFAFLLIVTILQQGAVHSGWLVMFTAGELIGSVAILLLAFRRGVGGLSRLDKACYVLLIADIILWIITRNPLLALHLSVAADVIAFMPTLVKTWREPESETPIFFMTGVIAPTLNIIAVQHYSYATLLFPVYLAGVNLLEVLLIIRPSRHKIKNRPEPTEPVI